MKQDIRLDRRRPSFDPECNCLFRIARFLIWGSRYNGQVGTRIRSAPAILVPLSAAACFLLVAATSPCTDRLPNESERAAIKLVLRGNGFVHWEEIELDDGQWEVDDARLRDGSTYDLKLAPETLRIVRRVRER